NDNKGRKTLWRLNNKFAVRIKPGIYFVTLSSDKEKYYKKFIVLR
ncbi:MAG: T9SS type A sorting domain-containing protein, partial [Candidatus Hydrothermae bacterium]|nr:T9SS type A sorting domain-containing protein [Candidatus Hydrothermae bacterium]